MNRTQIESPFLDPSQGNPPHDVPSGGTACGWWPSWGEGVGRSPGTGSEPGRLHPWPRPPGVQGSRLIPKYSQRASPTLSCCPRVWLENFGFHLIQKRQWQVSPTLLEFFYLCCTSSDILGLGWWVGRSAWESSLTCICWSRVTDSFWFVWDCLVFKTERPSFLGKQGELSTLAGQLLLFSD